MGGDDNAVRKILIPTDFSESSDRALEIGASLARVHGGMVLLIHVVEQHHPPNVPAPYVLPAESVRVARRTLAKIDLTGITCQRILSKGAPVSEILKVADEESVDLIVMSTHGRRGLTRLLMGSVAEGIVRKASCPVLTIKTGDAQQDSSSPESKDVYESR